MDITLANFQIKAIADLTAAMEQPNRDIILKSCTGSGKTIIKNGSVYPRKSDKIAVRHYD